MRVAHPFHVALAEAGIASGKKTFVPLGPASAWRWSVCVIVAVVAASATVARQHIAAENTPVAPSLSDAYPGMTRPHDVTTIALPAALAVRRVLVQIGDRVHAGDPLLMLDDEEARRMVTQLRFEAGRAKTRVQQLERTIELLDRSIHGLLVPATEASAKLAIAQRNAENVPNRQAKDSPERAQAAYDQAVARERRVVQLVAGGVVARQELEDAQIAVRVAADDLAVARRSAEAAEALAAAQALQAQTQADLTIADQQRQRQERVGELTQARLQQTEAETALDLAIKRLGDLTVRSTGDALVAEMLVKAGDRRLAGAPLVKLATVDPMIVDVDVPPSLVNRLARGDAAVVRVGTSPAEYRGRIRTIAPLPGDAGAHTLEIEFDNPVAELLAGQTASVRLAARR